MELLCYVSLVSCVLLLSSLTGVRCMQPRDVVECKQWRHIFTLDVIVRDVDLVTKNASLLHCGQACSARTGCQSFGFHKESRRCLLYHHLVEYDCTGTPARGTRYYWPRGKDCPTSLGYRLQGGICWRHVGSTSMESWFEARNLCRTQGAHLYTADSPHALHLLKNISGLVWLGARGFCPKSDIRWVNGLRVTGNWEVGEPSEEADAGPGPHCVMKLDKFFYKPCDVLSNFVCQVPQ